MRPRLPDRAPSRCSEPAVVRIVDEACIRCGLCVPACPHEAIEVTGRAGPRAGDRGAGRRGPDLSAPRRRRISIPATPEQVVNACYAAGFRMVTRGVIGDELVAAEYLKLWRDEPLGHPDPLHRSGGGGDDPARVSRAGALPGAGHDPGGGGGAVPAGAAWARSCEIVYAGVCPPAGRSGARRRHHLRRPGAAAPAPGREPAGAAATTSHRVPEERRRHLSAAGGLPLAMLEEARHSSRRFRKIRGLDELPALARAVAVDRLDLGFVDILSYEGWLDHPLSGPREELYWRRALVASAEPPRSRCPVVDQAVVASVGATFEIKPRRVQSDPDAGARRSSRRSARAPTAGRGTAGPAASRPAARFAEAAALGRASLRQCPPVPGAPGGGGAAGRGGGHADRARHLPGAARPAGLRDRAQQAEPARASRSCSSTSTGSSR